MKQVIALFTLLIISNITHSQEKLLIKQGNTVHYSVTVEGSTFPMFAWIDSLDDADYILTWSFENGRSGRFIVTKPSLDNARMGHWDRPIPGEELTIPGSKNVLMFSRSLFAELQKNKKAEFDEYTVTVTSPGDKHAFKLNNKIIDAVYMESPTGTKIWVLNDPGSPMILKIENNPFGVDVELTGIE